MLASQPGSRFDELYRCPYSDTRDAVLQGLYEVLQCCGDEVCVKEREGGGERMCAYVCQRERDR